MLVKKRNILKNNITKQIYWNVFDDCEYVILILLTVFLYFL